MSVTVRVPEESLVTVTPEKIDSSNVQVRIWLDRPFFIGQMLVVFSVVSVFGFNKVGVDGSCCNDWSSKEQGDLLPVGRRARCVVLDSFKVFLEFSSLCRIRNKCWLV